MKQNIILCDCNVSEIEEFKRGLENSLDLKFKCFTYIANTIKKSFLSKIIIYMKYFLFPIKILCNRNKFSIIIGWQQFYVICLSFYYSFFHLKKKNTLIAINFTYKNKKGIIGKIYFWFMKKAVSKRYLDFIHVLSNNYAEYISNLFQFPKDRIIVTPFGIEDNFQKWKSSKVPVG